MSIKDIQIQHTFAFLSLFLSSSLPCFFFLSFSSVNSFYFSFIVNSFSTYSNVLSKFVMYIQQRRRKNSFCFFNGFFFLLFSSKLTNRLLIDVTKFNLHATLDYDLFTNTHICSKLEVIRYELFSSLLSDIRIKYR